MCIRDRLSIAPNSFGQNILQVSNILVRGGAVRVYGRNVSGDEARVMGETAQIDENGRLLWNSSCLRVSNLS